ncbi:hypothetical protein MESS2_110085 [Mesorhizobium metallidurans STM 2683]|uniref:Uncharacterized protein n=1 Tax=Mesorhizobium metallidurans STM 2683 TaxID=1297569 RepID=M5EHB6_9HYPH|nr:hypothetical protein MESS2_110085 [Mesorhizobium metallidurans STM 2683]
MASLISYLRDLGHAASRDPGTRLRVTRAQFRMASGAELWPNRALRIFSAVRKRVTLP